MNKDLCIPGEDVLEQLEGEIIDEKVRAYQIALDKILPVMPVLQPFISDYKSKLQHQSSILLSTAKQIYANPEKKRKILRSNFPKYYQHTPLYSILLLRFQTILTPKYIKGILKKLRHVNRRYFRRRVTFLIILFEELSKIQPNSYHNPSEILRRIVIDKKFLIEYIYSYIELEQKKYQIIKKGCDYNCLSLMDYLNSFTITSVPFYQYVSSIWKTINEVLPKFLESKVTDLYHVNSLADGELDIVKSRNYRYKLVKEFPSSPQVMQEIFHDPEILMKHYPSQNILIEKIAPNRLRYTITEKIPLMKIKLKYDLVWRYKGNVEEWWVENSNHIKKMTGFAVYEETPEGNCRYADVLVEVSLSDQLKPFESMVIPALENMGRKNIEKLMENIYQYLVAKDDTILPIDQKECKEGV